MRESIAESTKSVAMLLCSLLAALLIMLMFSASLLVLLIIAVSALASGIFVYRRTGRIASLIRRLESGLTEMQTGADLRSLSFEVGDYELGLSRAISTGAAHLEAQARQTNAGRLEIERLLASMREGVLLLDPAGIVIRSNPAALAVLGAGQVREGMHYCELIRHPALLEFIGELRSKNEPLERELTIRGGSEKRIQAWGCLLADGSDTEAATMVVLNDISRLKQLEDMRQQFVANVSHELRTPLTALKASLETLSGGAIDSPEHSRTFLEIMQRNAERLSLIVEDLLVLSRVEHQGRGLDTSRVSVADLFQESIGKVRDKAAARGISLSMFVDAGLKIDCHPRLLEEALINLLENAITYSSDAGQVQLQALAQDEEVVISVRDFGCGIEPRHLESIFNRFYRVDSGRNREVGGSGLGLSIVKHIALAHAGRAEVSSTPGQGSIFTLYLPHRLRESILEAENA